MIKEIPNFPLYYFLDNNIYWKKNNKLVLPFKDKNKKERYKLKNIENNFVNIAKTTIFASVGIKLELPTDAKLIPNTDHYYADTKGNIYSFSSNFKQGIILKPTLNTAGYLVVGISKNGISKSIEIHQLILRTFIMENYIEKGLCCLHLDNNKTNNILTNLAVGTYSENNKAAYRDKLNPGNGLKKSKPL